MVNHDNSDTAFPSHGTMGEVVERGMSMRDYFAAKALVIVAAAGGIDHIGPQECASAAYEIADAMLAERAK